MQIKASKWHMPTEMIICVSIALVATLFFTILLGYLFAISNKDKSVRDIAGKTFHLPRDVAYAKSVSFGGEGCIIAVHENNRFSYLDFSNEEPIKASVVRNSA